MAIKMTQALHIGNAVRIMLSPKAGSVKWRLLRKKTATFSGFDDAGANVIHDGTDRTVLDDTFLVNGTLYYYALYSYDGTAWAADGISAATPQAIFEDLGADVLEIVRNRLDDGLQSLVKRNLLHHGKQKIQVLTAPPLYEDTVWPVVTVHCQGDASGDRGIGEFGARDEFDQASWSWSSAEGWLSRWQLVIVSWCLNPDQRMILRRAIKTVLIGNLPVFDAYGMTQIDVSQSDTEDLQSYSAPVYQTITNFTCEAPSVVKGVDPAIRTVVSTLVQS